MIHLMDGWKAPEGTPHDKSWDLYFAEHKARTDKVMGYRWYLGFQDRGMGHGNYAVITRSNYRQVLIVECPTAEIADHIMQLHNAGLSEDAAEPPIKVRCIDRSWEENLHSKYPDEPGDEPLEDKYWITHVGKVYDVQLMNDTEYMIPMKRENEDDEPVEVGVPKEMFEIVKE